MNKFLRATRADFLPASIIPFLIGTSYAFNRGFDLSAMKAFLGIISVILLHLSANLFNDYYDYKSGADNISPKYSSYFGGSRSIQEGYYTPKQVLTLAILFLAISTAAILSISLVEDNYMFLLLLFIAIILSVEYTAPPLSLAYNMLGEIVIFILFGIMLITGSFYLFSEKLSFSIFLVSLPTAFLVFAIIVCNEIPDFNSDIKVGKKNLLALIGIEKGYLLYGGAILFSMAAFYLNIILNIFPLYAVCIPVIYAIVIKTIPLLKNNFNNIEKLIPACRLTIFLYTLIGSSIVVMLFL